MYPLRAPRRGSWRTDRQNSFRVVSSTHYALGIRRVITLDEVERAGAVPTSSIFSTIPHKLATMTSDSRRSTSEGEAHRRRAGLHGRAVRQLERAERHVHVRVHERDGALHGRKRLTHQQLRAVDLFLRDDLVRLEVGNLEAGSTIWAYMRQ